MEDKIQCSNETSMQFTKIPPWHLCRPEVHVSVELHKTISKSDNTFLQHYLTLEHINIKWKNNLHIYTDGSRDPLNGNATASFYIPGMKIVQGKRMQDFTSSYRAELAAIVLALRWLDEANVYNKVVVLSDSLSALQAIKENKEENFVKEIIVLTTGLKYRGILICLEWIPSHCGIIGNETADFYAKKSSKAANRNYKRPKYALAIIVKID